MTKQMTIDDVLKMTKVSKPTLYRWMESHPKLSDAGEDSLLGHTFPKPEAKDGRTVLWSRKNVEAWWADNKAVVGRHPTEPSIIVIPWAVYRNATLTKPKAHEVNGQVMIDDHMAKIRRAEKQGDQVKLWFGEIEDAVMFKLRFSNL